MCTHKHIPTYVVRYMLTDTITASIQLGFLDHTHPCSQGSVGISQRKDAFILPEQPKIQTYGRNLPMSGSRQALLNKRDQNLAVPFFKWRADFKLGLKQQLISDPKRAQH